jgi:hypothetical protein
LNFDIKKTGDVLARCRIFTIFNGIPSLTLQTLVMSLRFLAKITFAIFMSSIFLSATPIPTGEHSAITGSGHQIKKFSVLPVFILPLRSAVSYQRLISPAGLQRESIAECWGYLTIDIVENDGYPHDMAVRAGGAAMLFYPDLDLIMDYAVNEVGVAPETMVKALTNCIMYCGWEG